MEQRVSLLTLGVADLSRARAFYQRLGFEEVDDDGVYLTMQRPPSAKFGSSAD